MKPCGEDDADAARCSWDVRCSGLARATHNPIRAVVENLHLEPNPGKQLIALSLGDPTVFGNLQPPGELLEAVQSSLESLSYNGYTAGRGSQEAREAVAKYSSTPGSTVDPNDVVLCSGCSGALDICITGVADPGQNILVPRPGFSIYRTLAEGCGIAVRSYDLKPADGWEADLVQMEQQIDKNTALLVVTNPSNPCGSVYSRRHLMDILEVARRNYLPVLADEIYEHMVFPGKEFISMGSLSQDVPILVCSGLAKRFLVPGWRIGWIIIHDRNGILQKEVYGGLQRMSQRTVGCNTLVQGALPAILANTPKDFFVNTIAVLYNNALVAYDILKRVEGLYPVMPEGAMYMMVGIDMIDFPFEDELEFLQQLMREESVFCLPGQCFDYPNYMRLVITVPEDLLKEACHRIADFCARHHKTICTLPT
ncbi:tyrosine aminotransferase isoform X1 [Bacillus rossius redtenbacheri]|uniref:tyrosine aminotransferase isoform X1 n=1 Tax=Bacillus rossius redtenbacheri TaxID=93214 RepID=UPI002FDDBEAB